MKNFRTYYVNKLANNHVNQYEIDGEIYSDLISYTTRVAYYNHTTNEMTVLGWFSKTTAKHINSFLEYYGYDKATKRQMENWKIY